MQPNQPLSDQRKLDVWEQPNGYWAARIRIPAQDVQPAYEQTERLFHDEDDARDWGEWMLDWITREDR